MIKMESLKCLSKLCCGPRLLHCLCLIAAAFNIICSGLFIGWPTSSLPKILNKNSTIPTTDDEGSWIATMLLVGGVCGSLTAAIILDRLGRKLIILFTSIPFFISWIIIAFANSASLIMVARFIAGISDGLVFCSVPVYLAEIAEPKLRGFIGSSITVACLFGMLLVNIIATHLSIKMTALVCSVFPLLLLVTFIWMPESPYYLIMKGKFAQARHSLTFFRRQEEVDDELKRLTTAVGEQNRNTGRYLDLFTVKSNRKAVYIVMGTRFGQQFSGAIAIMLYVQMIFKEIGDDISPITASIVYLGVQLLISFICTMFIDRIGRRPLLIASLIGTIITLFIEGCYFYIKDKTNIDVRSFSLIPVITLILFEIMFSLGLHTIPLLLTGEMFPTNVKAFAVSFLDIYFCIISTIAIKLFQLTKDYFGLYIPFFVSCVCDILTLIFVMTFVPETKGKTLEEVQEELKGNGKQNCKRSVV
ncbi:hypothetical protein ILUMI_21220 [Ignelater luminosus]|uniref:Major facilitator superfamily (MFS) profile domain-containing protein n=1 Tax=Ignelater luminosus TaxID=2038154 RepID=A0A8K0CI57_IGNLU|nr:hypothetical protein ILUMI_21220 [Ignelater luminosus]